MAENTPVAETASQQKGATKSATSKLKKRLNLDLSPEAYDLLQELSEESGKNMAEVLRTGLALYGIAREEKKKGRSLGVVEDDRVVKEIVIP
ncbi:hypothetical protein ACQ4M3_22310 [Leptolyngbya sp. AN03gr2]|uniref:hypothetical protein n=1 Tax=unclassified Leptolyngbya TaxID=2650499 RepID=UPI003D31DC5C